MFCPVCGRDNPGEKRFCASCGTNLETIAQALSGNADDFFTKTDTAIDQLVARYSEHVFKGAPALANDRSVANSWKLLGQGLLTSFVDMILFSLMWNLLPLKFLILLISTPIRLLSRRTRREKTTTSSLSSPAVRALPEAPPNNYLSATPASVVENTTERLAEYGEARRERGSERE
jgi:hypothetical protein